MSEVIAVIGAGEIGQSIARRVSAGTHGTASFFTGELAD